MVVSSGPTACGGLTTTAAVAAALAPDDFAFWLRAALRPAGAVTPDAAAAACSRQRGSLGPASYGLRVEWLGVTYVIEGVFARTTAGQLVQLEVSSTEDRVSQARALLAAWFARLPE
jgi:hypothetical protein